METHCPRACWALLQEGCKYKRPLSLHRAFLSGNLKHVLSDPEKSWRRACPSASYLCESAHPLTAQTDHMLTSLHVGFVVLHGIPSYMEF